MISGIERSCSRALLGLVLLALAVGGARAGDTSAGEAWTLEQLMQRLSQVKSARATFSERKEMQLLTAPLVSSGTLVYRAPDSLEKHTLKPRPESLVLDKDTITLEDKARNRKRVLRLQEYPVVWAFVESIRATLAGDLQALNRFYRVALEGNEAEWRLTLEPREASIQRVVERVRIGGARAAVRSVEVIEAAGDRSVMTITETR